MLGQFIGRSRAVESDAAWRLARQLPRRTKQDRAARRAALDAVAAAHGFSAGAAQSLASSLRRCWVGGHLPARETRNLGVRAFDALKQWHLGRRGKPRVKSTKRGLHSLAAEDGHGALRPKTDQTGRLVGLQWGAGFVVAVGAPGWTGRRGQEQQAELAAIEALIAAGKVLSVPIVRTVISGRDTYRIQLVCDGHPTRRQGVGDGRVSFDLGPGQIAVTVQRGDETWAGWIEPLADRIGLNTVRYAARSVAWTASIVPARRAASTPTARINAAAAPGSIRTPPNRPQPGWLSSTAGWPSTVRRCMGRWPTGCSPTAPTWRARSWTMSHGRRTSRSVRDRAPGLLVEMMRRKADSAAGD